MVKLQILVLAVNLLNGSIAPEVGNLKATYYMDLSRNLFINDIPSSLGKKMVKGASGEDSSPRIGHQFITYQELLRETERFSESNLVGSGSSSKVYKGILSMQNVNNVLLDEDMTAHVADFGITKLLAHDHAVAQNKTLVPIGYIAPVEDVENQDCGDSSDNEAEELVVEKIIHDLNENSNGNKSDETRNDVNEESGSLDIHDPSNWDKVDQKFRDLLVEKGHPKRGEDIGFSKDGYTRHFSFPHYTRYLANGEK
ncbi:uncharacterized protein LOC130775370 [Actinidia eriantha]|uniref:uncharacterized protein LOC130775370 n=1 Tax=Actinidia eriantha TaxID=165200 RepID=UPI002590DF09|nr:uncharacterized protein LOC130775370 [Actinidia eriantha]